MSGEGVEDFPAYLLGSFHSPGVVMGAGNAEGLREAGLFRVVHVFRVVWFRLAQGYYGFRCYATSSFSNPAGVGLLDLGAGY
jgi:hypothetical protein